MTASKTESQASHTSTRSDDLQKVIEIVLRQEERRKEDERLRKEKDARNAEQQMQLSDERLREAIHVIKWCVVGICAAMFITVVIGIWALVQVEKRGCRSRARCREHYPSGRSDSS